MAEAALSAAARTDIGRLLHGTVGDAARGPRISAFAAVAAASALRSAITLPCSLAGIESVTDDVDGPARVHRDRSGAEAEDMGLRGPVLHVRERTAAVDGYGRHGEHRRARGRERAG